MSIGSKRGRLHAWLLVLAGTVAVTAWQEVGRRRETDGEPLQPRGFWRWSPVPVPANGGRAEPVGEALARQLSLPYAAGVVRPSGAHGVRAWEPRRTAPGLNLYVSGHAAEAILVALDGRVLHRWALPFEEAFPGRTGTADSHFFRRAALLANGDLIVVYQGGGVARLDARSRPRWVRPCVPFNDLWVSSDEERILIVEKRAVARPDLRRDGVVLEDWIVTLDGVGRELARASLLAALERFEGGRLLRPLPANADILHTNTVTVLAGPGTSVEGPWRAGNLLVSWREIDTVAVLDSGGGEVLWAQRGPFVGQHEPSLLPSGRLLLFDNAGAGPGRSRVLELDPASGVLETRWPPEGVRFVSAQAGSVAALSNGNLLIVESERGTALEVSPDGEVVWEFASPHRAGPRGELVAVLLDLVRLPVSTPFLRAAAGTP